MSTEDPALAVAFTVTVTMTPDQREAYADARGTGLVELEIATRSPSEFADAIRGIPWVREYATVSVGAAPRQSAVVDAASLRQSWKGSSRATRTWATPRPKRAASRTGGTPARTGDGPQRTHM